MAIASSAEGGHMRQRLERSARDRVFTGVCGGIAEYLAINTVPVRLFFVLASIFTMFAFVLVYLALLIVMPLGQRLAVGAVDPQGSGADPAARAAHDDRRRRGVGYGLVAFGVLFFVHNLMHELGVFGWVEWRYVWPIALIGFGVVLLAERTRLWTRP